MNVRRSTYLEESEHLILGSGLSCVFVAFHDRLISCAAAAVAVAVAVAATSATFVPVSQAIGLQQTMASSQEAAEDTTRGI